MGEPQGRYTPWNKTITTTDLIPLTRVTSSSQIHRERKQNGGCQGLGRGEIGVLLLNGPEFVLQDENVMGTADGDDDPTV